MLPRWSGWSLARSAKPTTNVTTHTHVRTGLSSFSCRLHLHHHDIYRYLFPVRARASHLVSSVLPTSVR